MENNIKVWWNTPTDNVKNHRIFVSMKTGGNMMLREDGYDLVLFLSVVEAGWLLNQLMSAMDEIGVD